MRQRCTMEYPGYVTSPSGPHLPSVRAMYPYLIVLSPSLLGGEKVFPSGGIESLGGTIHLLSTGERRCWILGL